MRTVIGALVGLVVGAALVAALCGMADVKGLWPIIPAGLIAGLSMRQFANGINPSYVKGALAALATVLAMIGGQMGAAKMISGQAPSASEGKAAAIVKAETGEDVTEGEGVLATAPVATENTRETPLGTIGSRNLNDGIPVTEAIWLAVGCLLAYQIGKGGVGQVVVDGQEPAHDQVPAGGPETGAQDAATGEDA